MCRSKGVLARQHVASKGQHSVGLQGSFMACRKESRTLASRIQDTCTDNGNDNSWALCPDVKAFHQCA